MLTSGIFSGLKGTLVVAVIVIVSNNTVGIPDSQSQRQICFPNSHFLTKKIQGNKKYIPKYGTQWP